MVPTIYVVTPCLNTRDTVDRTILSVLTQSGDFRIRYHIQDGGSTDGNWERILWWQRRISSSEFPIQCSGGVEFTCTQEDDVGMYDAIIRGYAKMNIRNDQFMTWINADDILVPGALAFAAEAQRQFEPNQVSWFGGQAYLTRDHWTLVSYDRILPTEAIRAGMCDSIHWDFVQQEGTFYRKWLWDAIDAPNSIRTMKVAGDWNIWRLMAQRASLVQAQFPIGCFTVREGQLSGKFRNTYHDEMDERSPRDGRKAALKTMGERGYALRRRFRLEDYKQGQLAIVEEASSWSLSDFYKKVFNAPMPGAGAKRETKVLHKGRTDRVPAVLSVLSAANNVIHRTNNLVAYDLGWQFPAITEKHAFAKMKDVHVPSGVTYVAYPWATLIDKIQWKPDEAAAVTAQLREFCKNVPRDTINVTVCQHISMRKHMHLLREAGISHVFWTHATKDDKAGVKLDPRDPDIHPFPLYPAQVPAPTEGASHKADGKERRHLFSFIGARPNEFNLTQTRGWIIDELASHPRGFIRGRDGWFYDKVVYEHQILAKSGDVEKLVDQDATSLFKASLEDSVFSLCPSGTGPNSIRLWESIGAGAVPVILADTWAPPGNEKLWEAAAVFCDETPEAVRALPARLEKIAADPKRVAAMRQAMRQIWLLYGPDSFVYDVEKLMIELTAAPERRGDSFLAQLCADLQSRLPMGVEDALLLLRTCASKLLLDGKGTLKSLEDCKPAAELVALAKEVLPKSDSTIQHFDRVREHAVRASRRAVSAPSLNLSRAPKIQLAGKHSHRTPLSYEPFRQLIGDQLEFISTSKDADIIVTGFNRDFEEGWQDLAETVSARPNVKLMVFSEEPMWDANWSGGFLERDRRTGRDRGELPYRFVNHMNSKVFEFERYPYYPLTTHDFAAVYRSQIGRFAEMSVDDLLAHWKKAPVRAAFFAEHREGADYAQEFPDQDVWGLCAYRTAIAKGASGPGVLRGGKGWHSQERRQDLPDWHLDKLANLDRRVQIMSAYENTHQRHYISEKIFDSFAIGAVPVYYASKHHRVHELISGACVINTFGDGHKAANVRIDNFKPDRDFASAWLEAASSLQSYFADSSAMLTERQRIVKETLKEIEAL